MFPSLNLLRMYVVTFHFNADIICICPTNLGTQCVHNRILYFAIFHFCLSLLLHGYIITYMQCCKQCYLQGYMPAQEVLCVAPSLGDNVAQYGLTGGGFRCPSFWYCPFHTIYTIGYSVLISFFKSGDNVARYGLEGGGFRCPAPVSALFTQLPNYP